MTTGMPSASPDLALTLPVIPSPVVADTRLGPMQCAAFGEGSVILSLHGALGGYDQSVLLALAGPRQSGITILPCRGRATLVPLWETTARR